MATQSTEPKCTTKVYVNGIQMPPNLALTNDYIIITGAVGKELASGSVRSVILLFNYSKVIASTPGEITFFTVSDIHYGVSGTVTTADEATVDR